MKRIFSIVIILTVLLVGCGDKEPKHELPGKLYYVVKTEENNSDFGHIIAETRECASVGQDLTAFLELYLGGPESENLVSPFPMGTRLIEASASNGVVTIELNALFSTLNGFALTSACACLTRTVIEYTGATSVVISAENSLLDGQPSITMDMESLVFTDQYNPAP